MTQPQIKDIISKALIDLQLPTVDFIVEHPANETFGDYATNVALQVFPQLDSTTFSSPRQLAEHLKSQLEQMDDSHHFASIQVAGPGFINFTVSTSTLINSINNFITQNDLNLNTHQNKTVIVEYSSPNIAKPFTIGHLRSTIIGDAIANIKSATGWKVMRDNHLGDWGTQFGKLICAIKKDWLPFHEIENSPNPVKLLVELYVKFHQQAETDANLEDEARSWFKKLEDNDPEARAIWQQCIDWSWKEFSRIYKLLNVSFSGEFNQGRGLGESFFEDKMSTIIDQLEEHNLLTTGELGAKVVEFADDKLPPLMILKKDGATLYATRDLATDYYRKHTYQPDCIINEVGLEQSLYFQQIFQIEHQLGWYQPGQRIHVGHGMYRFKDGKMSTRKGNVIWLEEVIDKAISKAAELINPNTYSDQPEARQLLAQQIGIGALKWNDLKGEAKRDIVFDWNDILAMKGNSGPYIQYTYARTHSVLTKTKLVPTQVDSKSSLNDQEISLIRWLIRYPEFLTAADQSNNPSLIASFAYELCQRFNSFYNHHSILGEIDQHPHRLALTIQTQRLIKKCLNLLGIDAPEKM